ncbi:putative membrane protein [Clostridium bornimense]|uniref:Putative membrane protein n=1 Tax=Clostridium bornimense TaxID=1216932 RepID=W6RUB3_9CLOT|nr:DUF2752 domain-containing protein [Clostridium bornimense]CDM68216.1 putative membrane protein [Clostridium bornimense]
MDFRNKEKHMIIILMVVAIFLVDGKCLIKKFIGVPCPSCGLTRAIVAALNLNFYKSFSYHPLFWFIPIVIIIIIYGKRPLFGNKKYEIVFYISTIMIILVVYIVRMVMLFPNTVPMDYDKSSYVWKIVTFFKNII